MKKRTVYIILGIFAVQLIMIVGLLALPNVVGAIPGRYRVALAERSPVLSEITEGVIDAVAPESEFLPAAESSGGEVVDISSLLAQEANSAVNGTTTGQSFSEADIAAVAAAPVEQTAPQAEPDVVAEVETAPEQAAEADAETVEPEVSEAEAAPVQPATPEPTPLPEPTATPAPTPTPEPLPERVVLEGMNAVKQSFNNCGPANLTQVLNFYGSDITQADVASYLKPNPEDRNVSPWQIADYVNEQTPGFNAIARSGGTQEMIKQFVAAGYPVVVEKGYELPDSGWWGHYLTVYGYDDAKSEFYTQDSYLGPFDGSGRIATYDEIDEFWKQFNHTFYVVYRPEQEAEVAAILGPDMFDDFTMWKNTAARAEAETQANPEDALAWFNLGTALTRMGGLTGEAQYYQGGAQAFDKARAIGLPPRMLWYQFQPYLAYLKLQRYQDIVDLADTTLETQGGRNVEETFWYKGHALAFLGDIAGAREAYQEALRVNENFYPAQWSLDALNQ